MNGFQFAGISAGIKTDKQRDLGIIFSTSPCTAAALFTKNKVIAAPVILGKKRIQDGSCQAVLVNSGNANCFTGQSGMDDAETCSRLVAEAFGISVEQVMVSSTGVIGAPLPMDKFTTGIPALKQALDSGTVEDFADAILTTDTCRKIVTRIGEIDGHLFEITGIAKGSGMIRPDMATMLAYLCTDAVISGPVLKQALSIANEKSFNRISVDGDTSTNDTLLALASGCSKVSIRSESSLSVFQSVLDGVCLELARMIVKDGEGATKLVEIKVNGAASAADAYKACEAVAHSNLVKTAIYGEDPNWGRIVAAAGRSGARINPDTLDLLFDKEVLVHDGQWLGPDAEKRTAQIMKQDQILIELNLNLGEYTDHYLFCDFSENYVKINADYRT